MNISNFGEWKDKRRRYTFYVYFVQCVIYGMDFSLVFRTLSGYVDVIVDSNDLKTIYGIINAIVFLGPNRTLLYNLMSVMVYAVPFFLAPTIANWVDNTRSVKLCLVVFNFLLLAGTGMYILPYSPAFPIAGRFLQGFNYIMQSLIYAEVSRSYTDAEVQRKIPALLLAVVSGYLLGVFVELSSRGINVWFEHVHFTTGNYILLPSLLLTSLQLVLLVCFSYDLSKEYDLKAREVVSEDRISSLLHRLKNFFQAKVAVLLAMSFHSGFCNILFLRFLPLIIGNLGYNQKLLPWCWLIIATAAISVATFIVQMELSSSEVYHFGLTSFIPFLFLSFATMLLSQELLLIAGKPLFLIIYCISFAYFYIASGTFIIVTFNKLSYSSNQALRDSTRMCASLIGQVVAGVCAPYIFYKYFLYFSLANLVCVMFYLVSMLFWKEEFSKPVPSS